MLTKNRISGLRLNNIKMDNNRQRWGSNCFHCMAVLEVALRNLLDIRIGLRVRLDTITEKNLVFK
ncbi:hypothetical protein GCM10008904_10360 [Paraclostridium ghonii]|uniref:Uncharacterized protein n=1 Tax=Paraclostridium ghonii TaxID=29358 RepID=A0ABU0MYK5_9FIRM|nr:hypothetical protein [Paeniclostridium ghonii]MDQ0555935.1 hypothetical protein [Paeniclostridium ghonii]